MGGITRQGVHEADTTAWILCICARWRAFKEGIAPPDAYTDAAILDGLPFCPSNRSPWAARRSPSPILPAGNGIHRRPGGRSANTRSIHMRRAVLNVPIGMKLEMKRWLSVSLAVWLILSIFCGPLPFRRHEDRRLHGAADAASLNTKKAAAEQ